MTRIHEEVNLLRYLNKILMTFFYDEIGGYALKIRS